MCEVIALIQLPERKKERKKKERTVAKPQKSEMQVHLSNLMVQSDGNNSKARVIDQATTESATFLHLKRQGEGREKKNNNKGGGKKTARQVKRERRRVLNLQFFDLQDIHRI